MLQTGRGHCLQIGHFCRTMTPNIKSTMRFLKRRVRDRLISHPAQSPDLNVLEDIWSYLDRKIKEADVKTVGALKRRLKKEWFARPWEEIRNSVESMPARLLECEQLQGARTHY